MTGLSATRQRQTTSSGAIILLLQSESEVHATDIVACDWTASSEANCKVMLAARRRLIKGQHSAQGRCYHAHLGGILLIARGGGEYNAIIFPGGDILL